MRGPPARGSENCQIALVASSSTTNIHLMNGLQPSSPMVAPNLAPHPKSARRLGPVRRTNDQHNRFRPNIFFNIRPEGLRDRHHVWLPARPGCRQEHWFGPVVVAELAGVTH
jgi:hypothetical protein